MTYKEVQKFRQPWIWMILAIPGLLIVGLFALAINRQILHGQKFGNHPMSDNGLIVTFILVLLLFVLLAMLAGFAKLTTLVDENGIRYRFFPFQFNFHKIGWDEMDQCNVVSYSPVREYGGWGVRSGKNGKAYNVSGDKGLLIRLKTGKSILVGTQDDERINDFLVSLRLRGDIKVLNKNNIE